MRGESEEGGGMGERGEGRKRIGGDKELMVLGSAFSSRDWQSTVTVRRNGSSVSVEGFGKAGQREIGRLG